MNKQDVQEILSDIINIETVSSASNLDIIDYIDTLLQRSGVASRRVPSADGRKSSVFATIGDPALPGIVLSAHTDVVPAAGQAWTVPPFAATVKDGRIYGRGASDMKGFLALALAAVPMFVAASARTPVHLAFSYDEEVGCLGAPDLVRALGACVAPPALAIVGEPTSLRVARAHKGKISRRVHVTGRPGHSSMPHRAANAVESAAALVAGLREIARDLSRHPKGDAFDPPYTTVHTGSLHGGTALNLVPEAAVFDYEIRYLPGEDTLPLLGRIDALFAAERAALKAQAAEADIRVETLAEYPALDTPADAPATGLMARLAGDDAPPVTVAFGTEAGIYAAAGIPTLVCGPGDIARAHKPDEWIGLDELEAGGAMMARLARLLPKPFEEWMK